MFTYPSLIVRISIGKGLGLCFGIIGFILLPYILTEGYSLLRWGILLWYVTFGAVIGIFGIFVTHPILKIPMPWWVRAPILGGWMNFVLTFFVYDKIEFILTDLFGAESIFSNPFWLVLEGVIIGLIIDFFATRFGGEGYDLFNETHT